MSEEPFRRHPVATTSDLDEARAAMESVFLPLKMRLRGPSRDKRLQMVLNAVPVGGATVGYATFGRDVHVETVEAENYHINIPRSGATQSRTGRLTPVQSTADRAAIFMPDLPADIAWDGDCGQICVMIPRQTVHLELETMLDRPVTKPIEFATAMELTSDPGKAFTDALHLVERQSEGADSLLGHPLAAENIERLLVDSLLLAQPHNYTDALSGPRRPAAPPAVQQAIELIRDCPEQPWTTATLARRVAVSARSLQEGFQRCVGVPPMRYLREVRLNYVHDELAAATANSVSVSQVAGRWGFLYLGRFAAAYREKFGETPSQTLRRA
jgi:AraC-like DNA-binding protein